MKADWQAILDSIATSLRTDSVLVTSSLVFVVIFAVAIALYLVIKLLVNRAGLNLSATVSLVTKLSNPAARPPTELLIRGQVALGSAAARSNSL